MSSETRSTVAIRDASLKAPAGIVAGVVGSALMGVLMLAQMTDVLATAIPAMYGLGPDALGLGFGIHLFHGAVFGLIFAAALSVGPLREWADSRLGVVGLAVAYGVLVWVVAAVVVMPIWLSVMTGAGPGVPNVNMQSLVGHVVYGLGLGLAYPQLAR